MTRISQISPATATGTTAELFAAIKGKLGMVPNMMQAIGNSSAALSAFLQFSGSLAGGSLSNQQREQIALAVGEANHCGYCLAAHSALGKMAGLSPEQIRDARRGQAVDSESDALLRFAAKLVNDRGHVSNADVEALRSQGFSDSDITEVVANVALNIFTNYFNHVADTDTDIDFPEAECLACDAA